MRPRDPQEPSLESIFLEQTFPVVKPQVENLVAQLINPPNIQAIRNVLDAMHTAIDKKTGGGFIVDF